MFLRNYWYVAALAEEVTAAPLGRILLDEPLGALSHLRRRGGRAGRSLSTSGLPVAWRTLDQRPARVRLSWPYVRCDGAMREDPGSWDRRPRWTRCG